MRRYVLLLLVGFVVLLSACSEPEPGRSQLKLNSTPASQAFLNGEPAGETPLVLRLKPGRYVVVFRLAGHEDHESTFPLPADAEVEINATLAIAAPEDPSPSPSDLATELKELSVDLQTFFADLGVQPPGALAEVVKIADSGKLPTGAADLERTGTMLEGLAGSVEMIGTDQDLADRLRSLGARVK